ncbi:hypothetical protein ACVWXO_003818 [Bradyrhizobium sp. LM2.7]
MCSRQRGGGRRPNTCSSAIPIASRRRSLPAGPSSSMPIGNLLAAPSAIGIWIPGIPALLPGSVFWMNRPKFSRLLESGLEAIATRGVVGKAMASSLSTANALA